MDLKSLKCRNTACKIAETGKCLEGLGPDTCPQLQGLSTSTDDVAAPRTSTPGVQLPSADRLSAGQAASLLRRFECRVVAVLGANSAGKTSLIASVYELFQRGPQDGCGLLRSSTLHAFERACHHARCASRRPRPTMERTMHGTVAFYHLGLRGAFAGSGVDFLLADRPGEDYRSAADNPTAAGSFLEVARADAVTVLVDGEKLLSSGERHNVQIDTKLMLQALVDGNALRPPQRAAVVLTKLDKVLDSPARARAEADFAATVREIKRLFGPHFDEIADFRTAASPTSATLARGSGVMDLVRFWARSPLATASPAPASLPLRAIDRLLKLGE